MRRNNSTYFIFTIKLILTLKARKAVENKFIKII